MPFVRFVLRRAAALVLLCLGITFVAFALTQLVPSDPVAANLGDRRPPTPRQWRPSRSATGLDDPVLVQYWNYLTNLLQGDLGSRSKITSRFGRTSRGMRRRPRSSRSSRRSSQCPSASRSASPPPVRRNRFADHALRVFSLGGISMLTFWIALVALYVFFYQLGWFPAETGPTPAFSRRPPHGMYTIDASWPGSGARPGTRSTT